MPIVGALVYLTLSVVFWSNSVELYHIPIVNFVIACGASIFIMWGFERTNKINKISILELLGRRSIEIYVWHVFISTALRVIIKRILIDNVFIAIILSTICCLALSLMVGELLKRTSLYMYLFKPYLAISGKLGRVGKQYDD